MRFNIGSVDSTADHIASACQSKENVAPNTGQTVIPEAGLYYYKARVYDPMFGRFLQTDPIGSKDDLDLYAYTHDDPVNGSDPTGLCDLDCPPLVHPQNYEGKEGTGGFGFTAGGMAEVGIPKVGDAPSAGAAVQGSVTVFALHDENNSKNGGVVVAVTTAASAYGDTKYGHSQVDAVPSNGVNTSVVGVDAGVGGGVTFTNAKNANDLKGAATARTLTLGPVGLQLSTSKSGVWTASISVGAKGFGLGYSKQATNTCVMQNGKCQ